jgi:tRNA threonylcarbamoyladenosine biosynthesis protein TsaB
MRLLGVDTSSRQVSLAVLEDGQTLLEHHFVCGDDLAAVLAPRLDFVLTSLALDAAGIDAFAVCSGPGLFTGIRIGMATAKGLAFAGKKPLLGVTSLLALAAQFADAGRDVMALIDAGKGEVYLGGYRFRDGEPAEIVPPCRLKAGAAAELLAGHGDGIMAGSGAGRVAALLAGRPGPGLAPRRSGFLAAEIGRIALERLRRRPADAGREDVLPYYLRPSDAQARRADAVD